MFGLREDLRVMFRVLVVVDAGSAPGADGTAGADWEKSFCGLGGAGCWGEGSLGRVNCEGC